MFNYHPPSHLQDTGWQETPEKPAGLGRDRVYTRTNTYTHSFHSSTLWVMGFLTICLIQSTNKTRAGGLLRQCSATFEWVWAHETHICSQVYTCPSVITWKRKHLPKCIFVFPKLFHSAGFHKRNIKAPPKFFFSHLFPIFRLAFGLCPWGKVWEAIFALELFTLPSSFSRHGRVPKGGFNPAYTWSVSTQPPSGGRENSVQHWFLSHRPPTTATA